MPEIRVNIRGMDQRLFHLARVAAVKTKVTLGRWISEAIKFKLESRKKPG